jgi:hypothetical protein
MRDHDRYQAKASAQLRGILVRLANAMASVPAAMFVDVQQRHVFQLQRCTLLLEDEYQVAANILSARAAFCAPSVLLKLTRNAGGSC